MPRPKKSSYSGDKPPYSYVALCAMAIHSSPDKMMTLSEIYKFIVENFPFYRKNSTRWQNSLRHNLSFNDCFVKISKTAEHGGKGNYWTLHSDCAQMFQDGSFLRRKRRFLSQEDEKAKKMNSHKMKYFTFSNEESNSELLDNTPTYVSPRKEVRRDDAYVNQSEYHTFKGRSKMLKGKLKTFRIDDILKINDENEGEKTELIPRLEKQPLFPDYPHNNLNRRSTDHTSRECTDYCNYRQHIYTHYQPWCYLTQSVSLENCDCAYCAKNTINQSHVRKQNYAMSYPSYEYTTEDSICSCCRR